MFSFGNTTNSGNLNTTQNTSNSTLNNNNNNQTLFSQQQQQQPQSQTPIERLTRVSDLPQDAQVMIEQLNNHIVQQIMISDQFTLSSEERQQVTDSVETDVLELRRRWLGTQSALRIDQENLERLCHQAQADQQDALISTRFVDAIRTGNLSSRSSGDHILKLFYDTTDTIELEFRAYTKIIAAIENHLNRVRTVEIKQDSSTLLAALESQHAAFMAISSKVAECHDQALQACSTQK